MNMNTNDNTKKESAVTMKDVAREAGVSIGTVSKVINGIPVGGPYREKVEAAAQKLGYRMNPLGRALRTNKSGIIALVLPSIRHPFFAGLADEITCRLMNKGFQTQLMITSFDPEGELKCIKAVRENKADGSIALTYRPDLMVEESIPFVTIARYAGKHVPCVASDNYGGGQMAAEKLIELGCRKLLFIRIGSTVTGEPDKRASGFESICRTENIPYDMLYLNDQDPDALFDDYIRSHFENGKPDFDGIFCNTDHLALRTIDRLRLIGIKIPEEVQIIGYDGITDYISGKHVCSTIVQPVGEIAETAVRLLLETEAASQPKLVLLPVSYSPGGTTRD